ncbi:MAG: hypothetical protein U0165_20355 [Polyangiaceae bacterium]
MPLDGSAPARRAPVVPDVLVDRELVSRGARADSRRRSFPRFPDDPLGLALAGAASSSLLAQLFAPPSSVPPARSVSVDPPAMMAEASDAPATPRSQVLAPTSGATANFRASESATGVTGVGAPQVTAPGTGSSVVATGVTTGSMLLSKSGLTGAGTSRWNRRRNEAQARESPVR